MTTQTVPPIISPNLVPPPPPSECYQSLGFCKIQIEDETRWIPAKQFKDIKAAQQFIESQTKNNALLINGYLQEMTLDKNNAPLELCGMIQEYTLIKLEEYIMTDGLRANPMRILKHIKDALKSRNYLLTEALSLYCINQIDDTDYHKPNDKSSHHLYLAMSYEELKYVLKAEYHYTKAMELRHYYACGLAAFMKRQQRYSEAIKCVDDWFKRSIIHIITKSIPLSTVFHFYYAKARCYELMDRIPEAMDVYAEMIKSHENNNNAPIAISHQGSKNLLYIAVAYHKYGCYEESKRLHQQFTEIAEPDKMRYYAGLLRLLWILKQHETAVVYLKKAIQEKLDDAFIWYYYGMILRKNGEYDEAINCFEHSLDMMDVYKPCEIPLIDEFDF